MNYEVTITIPDDDVLESLVENYILCGFAIPDVTQDPVIALPGLLIWFTQIEIGSPMTLTWTDAYSVFTGSNPSSSSDFTTYPLQAGLGQTLTITAVDQGTLTNAGAAGSVTLTVSNNVSGPVTSGLALTPPGGTVPCPTSAYTLEAQDEVVLTPQPGIVLMFGSMTAPLLPGMFTGFNAGMGQWHLPAVMVPLTPASPSAALTFTDMGWGGAGTVLPPGTISGNG